MRIMAIDTTAKTASAAILEDNALKIQYTVNATATHSENMLPMIEHMLQRTGLHMCDIDLYAVSNGPGSFTGVRIGVSLIKGLAHGSGKPCIGINTLRALAENLFDVVRCGEIICAVMDARRDQVYYGIWRKDPNETLVQIAPSGAMDTTSLLQKLDAFCAPVFLVGDGTYLFDGASLEHGLHRAPQSLIWQSGYSVGKCALREYLANPDGNFSDAALVPVYYRPSQAQRMLESKAATGC